MTIQTIEPLTAILAGVLLLSLIAVESGGWFLTRVGRGAVPANALQTAFFRAGHAHAAVLLVLGLAILALLDRAGLPPAWQLVAALGVPVAALAMPAGFFLSVLGKDPPRPGRAFVLVWIGAGSLTVGLLAAGLGLVVAGAGGLPPA